MKEMISSYNHVDQYFKPKGKHIDIGKEAMTRIFGLSCEGTVPIGRESYNPIVVTYFIGYEHEHYIPYVRYLIAKANGRRKVAKLKALMEIMSFRQGNKFASALISTMLATKKEKV